MLSIEIEDILWYIYINFSKRHCKYGILELGKYGIQTWT